MLPTRARAHSPRARNIALDMFGGACGLARATGTISDMENTNPETEVRRRVLLLGSGLCLVFGAVLGVVARGVLPSGHGGHGVHLLGEVLFCGALRVES